MPLRNFLKRRFRFSTLFLLAGCLLICGAARQAWSNLNEERQAGAAASEAMTALAALRRGEPDQSTEDRDPSAQEVEYPDYILNPNMGMPVAEIDGKRYVGTLDIPVLNISLPVLAEYSAKTLKKAPALYAGSIYTGDAVICGHNYKSHFGPLYRLKAGDELTFTDTDGNVFQYEVSERETINGYDVDGMLEDPEDNWDLTLFTCTLARTTRVTVRCCLMDRSAIRRTGAPILPGSGETDTETVADGFAESSTGRASEGPAGVPSAAVSVCGGPQRVPSVSCSPQKVCPEPQKMLDIQRHQR